MKIGATRKGKVMNVNGITGVVEQQFSTYPKTEPVTKAVDASTVMESTEDKGVIYEPKLETPTQMYKANEEVIARLKADAQARLDQLRDLVQKLICKQGGVYADANDIWNALREGKVEVDPETKAQAQADIAEDGYWGVNATSDRIIDFAKALTGGDNSKLNDMMEAFKQGYEQAEKTWGGKLPEISQKTYDAVIEKFNNLMDEA
ncbi:hypothetical protein SAMN02910339_01545 [Lachnospiraceae bacterium YSD2013]|nr:hypothetical protein SAMN02910339_01545 [Lachnospiraceae bacterium YSD2013]